MTLQYLEVWPPSKGLSLPLESPQCPFLENPYGVAVQCRPISFPILSFLDLLGVMHVIFLFVVFLLEFSVCFVFTMN
jgi:hypothetical protein